MEHVRHAVIKLPNMMRLPAVIEQTTLSRATIYRKIKKGAFPKPVSLGERNVINSPVAWRGQDVADWINSLPSAE